MNEVWVIEVGEYEDRHIFGIAASVEAAVRLIKASAIANEGTLVIARWEDVSYDAEGDACMVGYFRSRYSETEWKREFDISRHGVQA